jgi:hypothetical protein
MRETEVVESCERAHDRRATPDARAESDAASELRERQLEPVGVCSSESASRRRTRTHDGPRIGSQYRST